MFRKLSCRRDTKIASYVWDGNLTSQTVALNRTTHFEYDALDHRIQRTCHGGTSETFVHGPHGNRISHTDANGQTRTFDYNDRDQLERTWLDGALEAEYAYDANGNRIEATTGGVTREFHFGARDRLLSLNVQGSPPEVEWTYDDAGFRIAETTPTDARRFRWDGESMAFETNVLGNLLMRYDHGPDRLLAETEAGNTRTWLTDALKTPVKRLTETGTTYSVTRYDEYGEVEEESSPDIPRFGFTGHQRGPQEVPDLYYAQQRWYNAATGRFISEDPVWGEPKRPPSLHRYLYAYANPTVFVDPDGRAAILSDIRDFFGRRREHAVRAAESLGRSDFARSGLMGGVTARTGTVLTSIGGGIFGLAESAVGAVNTGANLVGSATGIISAESMSELDETFGAFDSTVTGLGVLGGELSENPRSVARRGFNAARDFGHAVFVSGEPDAQARFGSVLPEVIGLAGATKISGRGLKAAGNSARLHGERMILASEDIVLEAARPGRSRPRSIGESPAGGVDYEPIGEALLRIRSEAGDIQATRTLIADGKVDGLSLVPGSNAIRGPGGLFIRYSEATSRAGQFPVREHAATIDPSVAARAESGYRFSPILENGRGLSTSPRSRSAGAAEGALHVLDYLSENAQYRETLKNIMLSIEEGAN